jgi:integrase
VPVAPIGAFGDADHLHQILVKYARVAHVRVSEKRRHGMHSLRHTLATSLEGGTPVELIADILGHQSVQSTGVFLKSSLGLWPSVGWTRTRRRGRCHDDRRHHDG